MNKKVVVEKYNSGWVDCFKHLKSILSNALADLDCTIEHVGSTSVPGLAAKPIVDLDIIFEEPCERLTIIHRLERIGYKHLGFMGIDGRDAFKLTENVSTLISNHPHNLYVCQKESLALQNHLKFRDYLRDHPTEAYNYGILKMELAELFPNDIDSYVQQKTPFITDILVNLELSKEAISTICSQNDWNSDENSKVRQFFYIIYILNPNISVGIFFVRFLDHNFKHYMKKPTDLSVGFHSPMIDKK